LIVLKQAQNDLFQDQSPTNCLIILQQEVFSSGEVLLIHFVGLKLNGMHIKWQSIV